MEWSVAAIWAKCGSWKWRRAAIVDRSGSGVRAKMMQMATLNEAAMKLNSAMAARLSSGLKLKMVPNGGAPACAGPN